MLRYILTIASFLQMAGTVCAQEPAPAKEYAIILRLNPRYQEDSAWKQDDMQAVNEHFKALQKLQAAGKLSFAGRTTNKASLGIVLLKNMTEAEAKAVMDGDKAVQSGIMSAELQPFNTVLKDQP